MSDCNNSANAQLKAIQARLDRIDDDLIATYAGISQLVTSLAANPLVSGNVAPSLATFNFSSMGPKLVKGLLGMIPGVNTARQLQHLESASLVSGMSARLQSAVEGMVLDAANQATNMINNTVNSKLALANAIESGLSGPALAPYQQAVSDAELAFNNAPEQVQSLVQNKLDAKEALDNAIAQGISGTALEPYLATSNLADVAIANQAKADAALNGFITTISDIGNCRTRSAIVK